MDEICVPNPLRLLLVEDSDDDVDLIFFKLRHAGVSFEAVVVHDETGYKAALRQPLDLILCDFRLPGFDAMAALDILKAEDRQVPLVIVSRHIGEDVAVEAMRRGAADYLLKDRLARLPDALYRAIERTRLEAAQRLAASQLDAVHRQLRFLSSRLMEIQDRERLYIARELHDQLGHTLTAAKFQFQLLKKRKPAWASVEEFGNGLELINLALNEARSLSTSLFPPQLRLLGLPATLESMAVQWRKIFHGKFILEVQAGLPALSEALTITAFRVIQEAATNAIRHSAADRIEISVCVDEALLKLQLRVRDNGCGFDLAEVLDRCAAGKSVGLIGLRERIEWSGGELHITSSRGAGCVVDAELPYAVNG